MNLILDNNLTRTGTLIEQQFKNQYCERKKITIVTTLMVKFTDWWLMIVQLVDRWLKIARLIDEFHRLIGEFHWLIDNDEFHLLTNRVAHCGSVDSVLVDESSVICSYPLSEQDLCVVNLLLHLCIVGCSDFESWTILTLKWRI
jgi:hypothetical protein